MAISTKLCPSWPRWLLGVVACACLAGCSSNAAKQKPACMFADGFERAAPLWVCGEPITGFELTAVGYTDASHAGADVMQRLATDVARVELLKTLRQRLKAALAQLSPDTSAAAETLAQLKRSVALAVKKDMMQDANVAEQASTPSGGLVVAVGVDEYALATLSREALQSSHDASPELWRVWLGERDFTAVQEAIIRQSIF